MGNSSYVVGKGRPPVETRFKKGESGNYRGRPKGTKSKQNDLPHEWLLGQIVTMRINGVSKKVSLEEAFVLKMMGAGLSRGFGLTDAMRNAIAASPIATSSNNPGRKIIITVYPTDGDLKSVMRTWRMVTQLYQFSKESRLALEPWIVSAALERLGDKELSVDEQQIVFDACRAPRKVRWPSWWTIGRG